MDDREVDIKKVNGSLMNVEKPDKVLDKDKGFIPTKEYFQNAEDLSYNEYLRQKILSRE